MKKASAILLIASMMLFTGVTANPTPEKVGVEKVSKIEKPYEFTRTYSLRTNDLSDALVVMTYTQCEFYFSETVTWGNYVLPHFEQVYVEPDSPVPLRWCRS